MPSLLIAPFAADVTPPVGHPLCAGWIAPAVGISDPLYARGLVLSLDGAPVVLCAVDWCEISNDDHRHWREALAEAAGTTPERVAVQCVHQHDAPWPDETAQALCDTVPGLPGLMDVEWCRSALAGVAASVRAAAGALQPVTHLRLGQAPVERLASNRRILGDDGKVRAIRLSRCHDAAVRAEPEGLIDPLLRSVSFWDGDEKRAVLHYYAIHPMSYYGDGWVTGDFVGHARERRNAEDGGAAHIYFTGCAGNIAAGKYNDGSRENRQIFTDRLYAAMVAAEAASEPATADSLEWRVTDVAFPPDDRTPLPELEATLGDPAVKDVNRFRAALRLAYARRYAAGEAAIPLTSMFLGDRLALLHLPGEPFIEYQLLAQELRPDRFMAVAGYSDCAPGYVPLARSYGEGGYEPTDAFVSPACEALMRSAIAELLRT